MFIRIGAKESKRKKQNKQMFCSQTTSYSQPANLMKVTIQEKTKQNKTKPEQSKNTGIGELHHIGAKQPEETQPPFC